MGIRFRKSFDFNGFKVNFSKTGVGYSYGVPGFRYTVMADGRERVTVSVPKTGISYVEESGSRKKQDNKARQAISAENYKTIQNESVDQLVSSEYQEFIAECNTFIKNWTLFGKSRLLSLIATVILFLIAIVCKAHLLFGILAVCTGIIVFYSNNTLKDLKHNKIRMNYEFDCPFNPGTDMVELMEKTQRSHIIQGASGVITNAVGRVHAGATNLYDTSVISIIKKTPVFLETNVSCYSIKLREQTLYILPDKILVESGNRVGAVSLDSVEMTYNTTDYRESGIVADDATVIGHTYQYVNNNGTPYRRYKNNREIPICLYGELNVTSAEGLNMKFFCSNARCTENFYNRFIEMKKHKIQENNKREFLYEGDDTHVRFVLGEAGENPIICFGINPSTANDTEDDPTISKIKRIAQENGYDGWIMLNLYPQRATDPNELHKEADAELISKNIEMIRKVFNDYPNAVILASWGDAIEKRKYLKECLKSILSIDFDRHWVCRGQLTAKGNPRHQLYVANNTPLKELFFDEEGNVLGCDMSSND